MNKVTPYSVAKPVARRPGDAAVQTPLRLQPSEAFRVIQAGAQTPLLEMRERSISPIDRAEETPTPSNKMFESTEKASTQKRGLNVEEDVDDVKSDDKERRTRYKAAPPPPPAWMFRPTFNPFMATSPSPQPWAFGSPYTPSPVSSNSPASNQQARPASRATPSTPFSPLPPVFEFSTEMED